MPSLQLGFGVFLGLDDKDRTGAEPAASLQLSYGGLPEFEPVGRVHERKIERCTHSGGLRAEVCCRTAMNAGAAEQLKRLDVRANDASCCGGRFDEEAKSRPSGDGLQSQCARSGKEIDGACAIQIRCPVGMSEYVEYRLTGHGRWRVAWRVRPGSGSPCP